jgi:hypothetical protein
MNYVTNREVATTSQDRCQYSDLRRNSGRRHQVDASRVKSAYSRPPISVECPVGVYWNLKAIGPGRTIPVPPNRHSRKQSGRSGHGAPLSNQE